MANDLTRIDTSVDISALYGSIERDRQGCDTLPALLSPDQRQDLREQRRSLHQQQRPISMAVGEQTTAQAAIALFLGAYINARTSDPQGTSRAYVAQMLDQPLFAIMQALDDFRQGRVYDRDKAGEYVQFTLDYAPSAPRLLDQVKKWSDANKAQSLKIERLLAITKASDRLPDNPEMVDRISKLMAGLADNLKTNLDVERQQQRQEIRAEAEEARLRAQRIMEQARRRNADADQASQEAEAHG